MRKHLIRGVLLLWVWILAGILVPDSDGPPVFHSFLIPDLWWLIAVGAMICLLFFIVSFSGGQHTHGHVKSRVGATVKMLLLAVPVPFILAFGSAEFGTDELDGRMTPGGTGRAGGPDADGAGVLKEAVRAVTGRSVSRATLLELIAVPEPYYGRRVRTIGMMSQGGKVPENHLYCFRYVMVCCVAHAMPVGVYIEKPDTFTVVKDAWYEIEGIVRPDSLDGYFNVKLDKAVIRSVPKPKKVWLYPR